MKIFTTSSTKVTDPVCGMQVDPCETNLVAVNEGQSFYFCAESCRKAFIINPQKFLVSQSPKRKGWWARYLDRLEKATGGKAQKCH
jgi:YHS domain-containing protein